MTTFKVLYIDDFAEESHNPCESFASALMTQNFLNIEIIKPRKLEDFTETLKQKYYGYDAYIIDLRLNENPKNPDDATYFAQTLAQTIRTGQNISSPYFHTFPLFLLTSDENYKAFYKGDLTSHDLFDLYYIKGKLADKGTLYEKQIFSIINSYKVIPSSFDDNDKRYKLNQLLNCEEFEIDIFNLNIDEMESVSEVSQFILKQIILRNGIIINENVLASRLGIDSKISEDWEKLKLILSYNSILYTGVLSDGWDRWWSQRLIDWWEEQFSTPLIALNATDRVKLITEKFGLKNLKEAKPIEDNLSNQFWTICQVYKTPLDTADGYLVNKNYEMWQDKEYVSFKSIIERDSIKKGIKLHPSEKDRFESAKSNYGH